MRIPQARLLADAILWCKGKSESQLRKSAPEGLVGRPLTELFNRNGARIITKLKLRDFETN